MTNPRSSLAAFFLACSIFFVLAATSSPAAPAKKPTPPPDMRKLVQSVDVKTSSIVIIAMYRHMTHAYHLDEQTTVEVDGVPATFSKINAGMEVADYTERDADNLDAVNLLSTTQAPALPKATDVAGPDKTIQAVLSDTNSVVIFFAKSRLQRTYRIDDTPALKVNGIPGKFSDIKQGMQVMDYLERDNDDLDSLTVIGYGN